MSWIKESIESWTPKNFSPEFEKYSLSRDPPKFEDHEWIDTLIDTVYEAMGPEATPPKVFILENDRFFMYLKKADRTYTLDIETRSYNALTEAYDELSICLDLEVPYLTTPEDLPESENEILYFEEVFDGYLPDLVGTDIFKKCVADYFERVENLILTYPDTD